MDQNRNVTALLATLIGVYTVFMLSIPFIQGRYYSLYNMMIQFLAVFIFLFVGQALLDMTIRFKAKKCEIYESFVTAIVGLSGFGVFTLLRILPFTKMTLLKIELASPYLIALLGGLSVALPIFLWKRFSNVILNSKACAKLRDN